MSKEEDKLRHSKRIHANETAVKKQTRIAKAYGIQVKEPHKFAKHHVMDCGNSGCMICGNRRQCDGDTIQEKRFKQTELYLE
jgi:hypothetical protein